jgi:DNA (cytosine-5)-methyltransferase 1
MKPRALDLFCGDGGAGFGLHLAGFDVVGVDIAPQPRYPFAFHQADAMTFPLEGFDFIWASPPCQKYSLIQKNTRSGREHPDLVAPTRQRLREVDAPFVIENVHGAPLLKGAIMLCGEMFGLKTYRHRWFECRPHLLGPSHHKHPERCPRAGRGASPSGYTSVCGEGGKVGTNLLLWSRAMGIDWMNPRELTQAIPPAYSKYIGDQMMPHVLTRMKERAA